MNYKETLLTIVLAFALIQCASIKTNTEFYSPILNDMKMGEFNSAAQKIIDAEEEQVYASKDRLLLHLDKGMIFHYQGEFEKSNKEFEEAERIIAELYTKSISKGAVSILLNDNALEYDGELYEDLYINIFKALNYLHLNNFNDAYVEVQRITNKLKEFDTKLQQQIADLNSSEDNNIEITTEDLNYFNNVLSNYLSYLIYRTEGEFDDSRISLEQLDEAWQTYPDVYNFNKPNALEDTSRQNGIYINVLAFTGSAPIKESVGARITTFNNFITISDPTNFHLQPIAIPGIKYGWNFKFEFPRIIEAGTNISRIEVYSDGLKVGELELLENMNNVAIKTFQSRKSMIYFKTISRAVLKGIGTASLGRTIKKEAKGAWGDILVGLANVLVDATEQADLRSWKTMPGYCFVGEFPIEKGTFDIEIRFIDHAGSKLASRLYKNYRISSGLNLLETYYLN